MYLIPTKTTGRLFILPRPRGGDWLDRDIAEWKRNKFDLVISALTEDEERELELTEEFNLVERRGLAYQSFSIPDRDVPLSPSQFERMTESWANSLRNGQTIGIHCRQGIGRSGMIAIGILQKLGETTANAMRIASAARGIAVPETAVQREWITRMSDLVPE